MGRIEKESQQTNKKRGCMSRPEILTGVTYFCCCPTDFTTQFSYQQSSRRAESIQKHLPSVLGIRLEDKLLRRKQFQRQGNI